MAPRFCADLGDLARAPRCRMNQRRGNGASSGSCALRQRWTWLFTVLIDFSVAPGKATRHARPLEVLRDDL